MGLPGGWELIIIFIVILLLFGAKRLPDLAKGLGKGISEFRKAAREVSDELQNDKLDKPKNEEETPKE